MQNALLSCVREPRVVRESPLLVESLMVYFFLTILCTYGSI